MTDKKNSDGHKNETSAIPHGEAEHDFDAGVDNYDDLYSIVDEIDEKTSSQRAQSLRAGLDDYELGEEDWNLLDVEYVDGIDDTVEYLNPIVAVVGRPNVGKSSLVNRIIGRREAIIEDKPGVTRDRVAYPAEWNDKEFTVVDTGGWESDARQMAAQVALQAEYAIDHADVIAFVVDSKVGITQSDEALVRVLRKSKKSVIVIANKVDDAKGELDAAELWSLGMGQPYPVSSIHGRGLADVLDEIVRILPEESQVEGQEYGLGPRNVALIGRPNVGKSSLLNQLDENQRVIVNEEAGTTRDAVDEIITIDEIPWRFIDTAGLRRKVQFQQGSEYYSSLRTQGALERAEAAVVILEADKTLTDQDIKIVNRAVEAGKALIIAFNKWDLVDEERQKFLKREIDKELEHVQWAHRINISAKTGWHKNRLVPALESSLVNWDRRIPTGQLNTFLGELVAAYPHPLRGGKQPRILFATQARTRPPRFVLFTTGFLDPGYRRFIEHRLREKFDFAGTPIEIEMRVRERRYGKGINAKKRR